MSPSFVVVTPTYPGREQRLPEALASVRSQLFTDFVHVVVGDGPTPGAKEACSAFRAIYEELPERKGGWGYACRNHALERFQGDYFLFLDDDNVLMPWCLQAFKEAATDGTPFLIQPILLYNKFTFAWQILNPEMPPKIAHIDMLNFCVASDVAKAVRFDSSKLHEIDFYYSEQCYKIAGRAKSVTRPGAVYF